MTSLRFDGLYSAPTSALYFKLRPDGTASGRFLDGEPTPARAAPLIWPGIGGYASGKYEAKAELFTLLLTFPFGERRYEGRLVDGGIELKFIAEGTNNPSKVYAFHSLSDAELQPPQVTRVQLLRDALAANEVARDRVEAAAALGDPVAILALQPFLEVEQVVRTFGPLGAPACLRVLLALSWSDDGEWYTPKQGVTKGGSRKEAEGKTLRALAKWALKPDDKLMAKAQEQFAEVSNIGSPFKFLDATMRTVTAATEADRSAAMKEALVLHLAEDVVGGYELVRERVVPWLMGTGDPLAEMLKKIK